jgi:hypothetical protein
VGAPFVTQARGLEEILEGSGFLCYLPALRFPAPP